MEAQQDDKTYLTVEGERKLREELAHLRDVRRVELSDRLRFAISQGDLSENADYIQTKEEYGFVEGKIQEIERMLRNSVTIEDMEHEDASRVRLGCKVTVLEEGLDEHETFMIVGRAEADPAQGKISNESPLGVKLLGRGAGEKVEIATPSGTMVFKIVKVE